MTAALASLVGLIAVYGLTLVIFVCVGCALGIYLRDKDAELTAEHPAPAPDAILCTDPGCSECESRAESLGLSRWPAERDRLEE